MYLLALAFQVDRFAEKYRDVNIVLIGVHNNKVQSAGIFEFMFVVKLGILIYFY